MSQSNRNQQDNTPPNDGTPPQQEPVDFGRQIGDTVRSALQSGDFSRLRDIGPAVQGAVRQATSNLHFEGQQGGQAPKGQQRYGGMQPGAPQQNQMNRYAYQYNYGKSQVPSKKNSRGPSTFTGVPSILLGTVGAATFGVGLLVVSALTAAGLFGAGALGALAAMLAAGGICAIAIGSGVSRRRLAGRIRYYYAAAGEKGVATIQQLAAACGQTEEKVRKDICRGMQKGMMPDVRMDKAETCMMVGDEAYKMYLAAEKARLAREEEDRKMSRLMEEDPTAAAMEKFKKDGAEALRRIRRANDAIPEEEISNKMERLESTASKIFVYVQKHPEKLPETRKLMNYYLPTTIKLLEKYRQYNEMEVQLQNVEDTKVEIESSLDTINVAFENLLESLYQDDTLDVSTDISALHTMLRQEGLAGRRFTIKTDEKMQSTIEEEQE